jgi:tRNA1Val (adenine37-N6)-methyltransferase
VSLPTFPSAPAQGPNGPDMPNPYFQFKQFIIYHDRCAMKVTTDVCLFGAWCAEEMSNEPHEETKNILDIGSGSGLLSLMIAQKNDCLIDAIEIDKEAAQQAKENIFLSPWKDNINLHHADALNFSFNQSYNVIVSNPPFYENEIESANKQKNVAHHSDGLKLSELFSLAKKQLAAQGSSYLLLPFKRKSEAEKILRREKLFIQKAVIVSQSVKHSPFRLMIKAGHTQMQIEEKHISITGLDQQYTPEFISLLKDYYLYL